MNASKLRKIGYCKNLLKFRYSHSAVAKSDSEIGLLPKQDAKITRNVTGVTIASIENYMPLSQVSVVIKAGPRYEPPDHAGISHCLRNCSAVSTSNNTAFSITRRLEVVGAKLSVSSTREYLMYTMQCPRDDISTGLEILADVTTQQSFKPWEVEDASPRMNIDIAFLDKNPEAALIEALHQAAFRGGLSHSLFCNPIKIGKYNNEMLQDYVTKCFTAPRTVVAGLGIDHDHLENAVTQSFNIDRISSGNPGDSKFGAGEVRVDANVPYSQVAIVAEGAGMKNTKDMLSLGLFQCLLGNGVHHKHATPQFSKLGEAASKSTSDPFAVSSLNINYSDTGLFGVHIAGNPNDMTQLIKSVVSYMRGVTKSLSDESIQIAKHKLKAKLAFERESASDQLQDMAIQTASTGQIRDFKAIEKAIDALTTSDVSAIASKVMKAKPAMAAVGPLHDIPHLDELI